jgi:hypothetical protein
MVTMVPTLASVFFRSPASPLGRLDGQVSDRRRSSSNATSAKYFEECLSPMVTMVPTLASVFFRRARPCSRPPTRAAA